MSTDTTLLNQIESVVDNWKMHRNEKLKLQLNQKLKRDLIKISNQLEMDDHIITLSQLCQRLTTNLQNGLSPVAAKRLLLANGPNIITANIANGEWIRIFKNLFDWFNSILWFGSLLCFITYLVESYSPSVDPVADNLYLGCALAGCVSISASFSYYQEAKSANIFITFRDLIPRYATVIRAGSKLRCPVIELVVGDLIEIKAGDRVPADMRIIKSFQLKCVNTLLTGNNEPFMRSNKCSHTNPFMTNNLVFLSTNCIEGTAQGIVIRTGDQSLMSDLLSNYYTHNSTQKPSKSILNKNITFFIRVITILSLLIAIVLSAISYIIGWSWLNVILFMIALFVSQIPEGLYPTLTTQLSLAAKRMSSKNCLVTNYETVETLGLTSIIITNKTGTLTQNRMVVSHIWADNFIFDSENLYNHSDGIRADLESPAWEALIRIACLCNKAEFSAAQARLSPFKRQAIGDSTDIAILKYMEIMVGCVESYRQMYPKVFDIPFNSQTKHSLTISKSIDGFWLCMKGSPEFIIDKCSTILTMGSVQPFDSQYKYYFKQIIEELGCFGERVIAFCDKYMPYCEYSSTSIFDYNLENYPTNGFRFIGLISLLNPPRASVPNAVHKCRSAGIKIVMITGDHPVTAKAIASAVGIFSTGNQSENKYSNKRQKQNKILAKQLVISGDELQNLSDIELKNMLNSSENIVFARTSPNQKSRLVKCCRNEQSVIAVTGDGGHDLETVKNADITIAMGIIGSDISKQNADIVLLDDDFASIVSGIEEGRVIFDNLRKSICYTLSSKTPIICSFLLYISIDIPLPLGSITILCIDLITDMVPAISLAYELPEYNIMKYKPRDSMIDKLVNTKLLYLAYFQLGFFQLFGGLFTYAVIMNENGFNLTHLIGVRRYWDSIAINDLTDSYGQEWTYHKRKTLEYTCRTAFFAAVVLTKWSALICCKTRRVSILKQKMKNDVLTFSLFFELGLAIFLSYCPGLDKGINLYPLKLSWWFCSIPFSVLLIIFDELRKYFIRHYPNGWVENEFFY